MNTHNDQGTDRQLPFVSSTLNRLDEAIEESALGDRSLLAYADNTRAMVAGYLSMLCQLSERQELMGHGCTQDPHIQVLDTDPPLVIVLTTMTPHEDE